MQIIKNKPSLFILSFVLVSGMLLTEINQVQAVGDAYFSEDTTVTMDNGDFIITAGSNADEVITSATTVTVLISANQTFTLKSSGRKVFGVAGTYSSKTCTSTESSIILAPVTGDAQSTVTITPSAETCTDTSSAVGSGTTTTTSGGGTTTVASTPTPTPTPSPAVSGSPAPSPSTTPVSASKPTPASRGFVSLSSVSLKDGDVISASGSSDPDVYIVNPHGYKRLFLNPAIFGFYGHLGGFSKVKKATSTTRDVFVTSGLFRNCETNDKKVYGVETTGEDTGILHWVNATGDQAVADDPNFFKKVFCINTKEFNWYKQGAAYTSVNQIPDYSRKTSAVSSIVSANKKYKVFDTDSLNVRETASTIAKILGKLLVGEIIESLEQSGEWHKIKYQNKDGWVHSDYLKAI